MSFSKYVSNTSWLFLERILRMVSAVLVGILVARYLGPEQYGVLNFAISVISLVGAIASLGLDSIIIREYLNKSLRFNLLAGTAFSLKLAGTILMWGVVGVFVLYRGYEGDEKLVIFLIAFASIFQVLNVIDFNFQAAVLSKYVVFVQLVQIVFSIFIRLLFVFVDAPLYWFAVVITLESVVYAIGMVVIYHRVMNRGVFSWCWSGELAIRLLREGGPYIISGIAISAYLKIDQVMVKEMIGNSAVGVYAAAARLSEAWYFVPVVVVSSLFPVIIESKKLSEEVYYERLKILCGALFVMALFIAVPISVMSELVVDFLYGEAFRSAGHVLAIHVWAAIFVFWGVVTHRWYVVEGLKYYALVRSVLGLALNVFLNYLFIPVYGVEGAAASTVISQCFVSFVSDLLSAKSRRLFVSKMQSVFLLFQVGSVRRLLREIKSV